MFRKRKRLGENFRMAGWLRGKTMVLGYQYRIRKIINDWVDYGLCGCWLGWVLKGIGSHIY